MITAFLIGVGIGIGAGAFGLYLAIKRRIISVKIDEPSN